MEVQLGGKVLFSSNLMKKISLTDIKKAMAKYDTKKWGDVSELVVTRNNESYEKSNGIIFGMYVSSTDEPFCVCTNEEHTVTNVFLMSELVYLVSNEFNNVDFKELNLNE